MAKDIIHRLRKSSLPQTDISRCDSGGSGKVNDLSQLYHSYISYLNGRGR
jgi:hypothetical protein